MLLLVMVSSVQIQHNLYFKIELPVFLLMSCFSSPFPYPPLFLFLPVSLLSFNPLPLPLLLFSPVLPSLFPSPSTPPLCLCPLSPSSSLFWQSCYVAQTDLELINLRLNSQDTEITGVLKLHFKLPTPPQYLYSFIESFIKLFPIWVWVL